MSAATKAYLRSLRASSRGAVAFPQMRAPSSTGGVRRTIHSLKEAFHRVSWGLAGLSFVGGYFLPQTLAKLGWGYALYNASPQYAALNDTLYAAASPIYQAGTPSWSGGNPWGDGGLVGWGKSIGAGLIAKFGYDFSKTGQLSRGKLNVGIPFSLGMILDGPELAPMSSHYLGGNIHGGDWTAGNPATQMLGSGGVAW